MAASLHNCEWKAECCPNKASVFSVTQSVVCVWPPLSHTQTHTLTQMCQGEKKSFFLSPQKGIKALQWHIFSRNFRRCNIKLRKIQSVENIHISIFLPPPLCQWMLESFFFFLSTWISTYGLQSHVANSQHSRLNCTPHRREIEVAAAPPPHYSVQKWRRTEKKMAKRALSVAGTHSWPTTVTALACHHSNLYSKHLSELMWNYCLFLTANCILMCFKFY